jgi:hypothetical protein
MALYYAKSTGGFYDTETGVALPADAVEITAAQHTALLVAQVAGQVIQADANGAPEAVTPVVTLTLAQQAAKASGAGMTLTLSGTLTLAATLFPTDATTQAKVATMASMAARGVLPTGCTAYPMVDAAGTWHEFTAAQYQAVAAALASYVADCDLIASAYPGAPTTLPTAAATLTLA